jgi:hypothetical protein
MTLVGRKVASQPRESLSNDRLALVERYMIDADEAEARSRAAAKEAEAQAQRAAEEQRREAERVRRNAQAAQREPDVVLTPALPAEVELDEHRAQLSERLTAIARGEARRHKSPAKAERQAAKEAARLAVAAEKREARERKALAKAAAKRRSRELKARAKLVR